MLKSLAAASESGYSLTVGWTNGWVIVHGPMMSLTNSVVDAPR